MKFHLGFFSEEPLNWKIVRKEQEKKDNGSKNRKSLKIFLSKKKNPTKFSHLTAPSEIADAFLYRLGKSLEFKK